MKTKSQDSAKEIVCHLEKSFTDINRAVCTAVEACRMNPAVLGQGVGIRCAPWNCTCG